MQAQMKERHSAQSLVLRAQGGDRIAFGELIERYRERLHRFVVSRLGESLRGQIEVEDVTQEAFTSAVKSIESFEWQGDDSFFRWLEGIAEHVIVKAATRGRRRPLRLSHQVTSPGISPSRGLRREERFDRLERALEDLPPDYREVLRLSRIEGLRHQEIAARMNRSHAAVRQLVIRALRKLREHLGDTESLHLPGRTFDSHGDDHAGK